MNSNIKDLKTVKADITQKTKAFEVLRKKLSTSVKKNSPSKGIFSSIFG